MIVLTYTHRHGDLAILGPFDSDFDARMWALNNVTGEWRVREVVTPEEAS